MHADTLHRPTGHLRLILVGAMLATLLAGITFAPASAAATVTDLGCSVWGAPTAASITLTSAVPAGDTIVVASHEQNQNHIGPATYSDSVGNSPSFLSAVVTAANDIHQAFVVSPANALAVGQSITVTQAASAPNWKQFCAVSISGLAVNPVDRLAGNSGQSTAPDSGLTQQRPIDGSRLRIDSGNSAGRRAAHRDHWPQQLVLPGPGSWRGLVRCLWPDHVAYRQRDDRAEDGERNRTVQCHRWPQPD